MANSSNLFNLDTTSTPNIVSNISTPNIVSNPGITKPLFNLSGLKFNDNICFKPIASTAEPAQSNPTGSLLEPEHNLSPATGPKKTTTRKPRKPAAKTASAGPTISAHEGGSSAILVASLGTEYELNQETGELSASIHDFEIKESLFKPEELGLNPLTDVFVKSSRLKNDELVKYYIIKYRVMEYKCAGKNCPMKGAIWRRKPAYLILNRKNNRQNDLSISNISLICPNCYVQEKGVELFNSFKTKASNKCINCAYPIKAGFELCFVCTEKIKKIGALASTEDYAELTIKAANADKAEIMLDINKTLNPASYYKEVSSPATNYSLTSMDIDKEIAELGVGFNISSTTYSSTVPNPCSIDIDAELAKYKSVMDNDLDSIASGAGINKSSIGSKPVPPNVIHYTKHKSTNTGTNNTQSKLNTNITPALLDELADI